MSLVVRYSPRQAVVKPPRLGSRVARRRSRELQAVTGFPEPRIVPEHPAIAVARHRLGAGEFEVRLSFRYLTAVVVVLRAVVGVWLAEEFPKLAVWEPPILEVAVVGTRLLEGETLWGLV